MDVYVSHEDPINCTDAEAMAGRRRAALQNRLHVARPRPIGLYPGSKAHHTSGFQTTSDYLGIMELENVLTVYDAETLHFLAQRVEHPHLRHAQALCVLSSLAAAYV